MIKTQKNGNGSSGGPDKDTAAAIAQHQRALMRWPGVSALITDCQGKYFFDTEEADRACDFFHEYLTHHKGEFDGQPFDLEDWQRELVIRPMFGWKRTADRLRRFRKVYLEIPKKNGKTKLSAGIGLYVLFCDREPGCEVVCAAADREQGQLVFDDAKTMVEDSETLSSMSEIYRRSIVYTAMRSSFKVVSADVRSKHGPNIHCLIIDEFHAQPDRELYDTLSKGVAARRQPLVILITTAGVDLESVCREEHDYAISVMKGTNEDETFLPIIFGATLEDDWTAPAVWAKANPGIGKTVKVDYLEGECRAAISEPRKQNAFKRLHLNIWTQQFEIWIPLEEWDACQGEFTKGGSFQSFGGLDLSSKLALTALVVVQKYPTEKPQHVKVSGKDEPDRVLSIDFRLEVHPYLWLPEDNLHERIKQDRVRYDLWHEQGLLRLTPGPMVDYDVIYDEIVKEIGPRHQLKGGLIGFDPYNGTQFAGQLQKGGYTVLEIPQNVRNLSEPAKLVQAMIHSHRIRHDGHALMRWNMSNLAVKEDKNGNIFPFKPSTNKRIDGGSALINAAKATLMAKAEPQFQMMILGGGTPPNRQKFNDKVIR